MEAPNQDADWLDQEVNRYFASTRILILAIGRGLEIVLWVTVGSGIAFLVWLAQAGRILSPIPIDDTVIILDLLQTLAVMVALTALEVTIVVTSMGKYMELVTSLDVADIRDQGRPNGRSAASSNPTPARNGNALTSLFRKVRSCGIWTWCVIATPIAILVVRQGVAQACLDCPAQSATTIAVNGWLALASASAWAVLVFVVSLLVAHIYYATIHVVTILDESKKRLQVELDHFQVETERLQVEIEHLQVEIARKEQEAAQIQEETARREEEVARLREQAEGSKEKGV